MIELGHISPWVEGKGEERIASTLDIKAELRRVKPNSLAEYSLCFEAALDNNRPLSERERYLLARYGKEYADKPEEFNQKIDDLERRAAITANDRDRKNFVLIEKSPTLVFVGRLASSKLEFNTRLSGFGKPYGALAIELDSSISTVLDEDKKIVYELTRDFVAVEKHFHMIEEGTTTYNGHWDVKGSFILDPEKPYIHEGDESIVRFGFEEIFAWQDDHPEWEEHVYNMINAWSTGSINYPVARKKPFESSLRDK